MGTFTAQILVGQSHRYEGGIVNISHMLYLSENSTPAWLLTPVDLFERKFPKKLEPNRVWIPTLENMLEDALLMYGIYVVQDELLVEMAKSFIKSDDELRVELYRDISTEHLQRMYKRSRQMESDQKLMVSVFEGSSINNQLKVLEQYKMEVEVTRSMFLREFNVWKRTFEMRGKLDNMGPRGLS